MKHEKPNYCYRFSGVYWVPIYKNALVKLDDKLNTFLRDEKRHGKDIKDGVEKRVSRYRTEIITLSRNHHNFKKVVFQLDNIGMDLVKKCLEGVKVKIIYRIT